MLDDVLYEHMHIPYGMLYRKRSVIQNNTLCGVWATMYYSILVNAGVQFNRRYGRREVLYVVRFAGM